MSTEGKDCESLNEGSIVNKTIGDGFEKYFKSKLINTWGLMGEWSVGKSEV